MTTANKTIHWKSTQENFFKEFRNPTGIEAWKYQLFHSYKIFYYYYFIQIKLLSPLLFKVGNSL